MKNTKITVLLVIFLAAALFIGAATAAGNDPVNKSKVSENAELVINDPGKDYCLGDKIKLTGTAPSDRVSLFLDGSNFENIPLKENLSVKDTTWEYTWDTKSKDYASLELGEVYTISVFATDKPTSDTIDRSCISIILKKPSHRLDKPSSISSIVAKGDKLRIRGTVGGSPDPLNLYLFGPGTFKNETIKVKEDGSYEYDYPTDKLKDGEEYFVVIHYPMSGKQFNVEQTGSKLVLKDGDREIFRTGDEGKEALADFLAKKIGESTCDECKKFKISIVKPVITTNDVGNQTVGSNFSITGTTNLAEGDPIYVALTPGSSYNTKVKKGETETSNSWSVDINTAGMKSGNYTVKVSGISGMNAKAAEKVFSLLAQKDVTPANANASATAPAPKTPGFGAFIALAGLGAVAHLVLRRN
ncbi:MAG TPA: PGF-CTERM sorting domain-containing protein [Methanocorpusculum sp.]|nr:PGF-CTERM sorting domain-containing protein [Methanocorpusculum sp.]